jgi:hypothetical protein
MLTNFLDSQAARRSHPATNQSSFELTSPAVRKSYVKMRASATLSLLLVIIVSSTSCSRIRPSRRRGQAITISAFVPGWSRFIGDQIF